MAASDHERHVIFNFVNVSVIIFKVSDTLGCSVDYDSFNIFLKHHLFFIPKFISSSSSIYSFPISRLSSTCTGPALVFVIVVRGSGFFKQVIFEKFSISSIFVLFFLNFKQHFPLFFPETGVGQFSVS